MDALKVSPMGTRAEQATGVETAFTRPTGAFPEGFPLVSVVITTRGRRELVRETITSVVAQTYPGPIECLVVHDREQPDDTLAELGRTDRRVVVMPNTGTPGLAGARNFGVRVARGEFIASCDDDDVWHAQKLEKQIARLRSDPELIAVGCGLRLLFPGRSVDWPARAEVVDRGFLLRNRVKELHSSTLVMRRDAFALVGEYDEELPMGRGEDYDWVLRLSSAGKLGCVVEPLADIRKDHQSWYQGPGTTRGKAEALEMFLAKHPEITSSRRGHARVLGQIAWAHSAAGARRTATGYALRSLRRWAAAPYAYLALFQIITRMPPNRVLQIARLFGRGIT
jgi:glycosyltransferase involved in cell wall biosynthesis